MLRLHPARALAAASLVVAMTGCGDPPAVTPDTGPLPPSDSGMFDGGPPPDRDAPRVVDSAPDEGSIDVPATDDVVITFSEPMAEVATYSVRVDGVDVAGVDAGLDGATLTLHADAGWPVASEVEIRIADDWEDRGGNRLDRPFVLRFWTEDDAAPSVVESTPAEDAVDVSTRLGAIRIRFSEPMDQAAGTLRLEGGPGAIDASAPSWSADAVTYPIEGLANDTTYRVVLEGFRDRQGNALDGVAVIADGAIDFTTRADDEAPQVTVAAPFEGQVDVSPSALGDVVAVRFDEPMDPAVASVPVTVGTTTSAAAVTWASDTQAQIDVAGVLRLGTTVSIDLRAMRDAAGNLLAIAPHLVDGRLDFTTGVDAFVPAVIASTPAEGATGVSNTAREVRLAFSEAMDESISSVQIRVGSGTPTTVVATWTAGGTVLVIDAAAISPGTAHHIDVRGLRDRTGTPVSSAHPYLGDGVLDFALSPSTGASCDEPLGIEHAVVTAGVYAWDITAAQRTRDNGSASCDLDGHAGTDAVIHYRKTTPATGTEGGRALVVRTANVSNRANIEVFEGVCSPRDPGAAAARVRCGARHEDWAMILDVPAGDYFVWVSTADGSPLGIDVSIEEIEVLPEGQLCASAYDTSSTTYTAPATAADPHVWTLPGSTGASSDIADTNAPFQALSCVDEYQDDVVLTHTKAADDTVLDITITPTTRYVSAEVVFGGCRPDDPGATRAGCYASVPATAAFTSRRITARGPAGPFALWMGRYNVSNTFPGATVAIREIPPPTAPGSSCATAIPIAGTGTVAIAPTHAGRYDGPTCIDPAADVTWYAFETTTQLTHVRTDVAGSIGLVGAGDGRQIGCSVDAAAAALHHFAPIGSRVCVAVATGTPITQLTIEPIPYDGVGATAPAALAITHPSLSATIFDTIVGEDWLEITPTRFYQNAGTFGVVEAPPSAGASFLHHDVDSRSMGGSAVAIGEQLFTIINGTSYPRVFRLADASGTWSPTVWDRGAATDTYPAALQAIASDGVGLFVVPGISASATPRETPVYQLSTTAPGLPTVVGRIAGIYSIDGLAVDGTWMYVVGRTAGSSQDGIYRLARADLSAGGPAVTPTRIHSSTATGLTPSGSRIILDSVTAPRYLYVRSSTGALGVIGDPAGPTPRFLGIVRQGESGDRGFDVDPATGAVTFFSTLVDPRGAWYRMSR